MTHDERRHAPRPKILTDSEVELMLTGDRREVDRMMLTQINSLSEAFLDFRYGDFPAHARAEEETNRNTAAVMEILGSKEQIRARVMYIESAIEESKARTRFFVGLRDDLMKKSLWGAIFVLGALFVYWWNGNVSKP